MRSSNRAADPPPPGFAPVRGNSEFSILVGPFWEKLEAGRLYRGIRLEPRHSNRLGIAHGGLLLTFADTLLGASLRHALGSPRPAVTVKLSTDLMSAARVGEWLEGVFQLLATRKRVD